MTTIPQNISTLSKETTFLMPGPAGQLEVLISAAPTQPKPVMAIICHPHPLYGGTMTNKVVTTLAKVFQILDIQSIRFNFRGIGQSAGTYANGIGELDDLFFLMDWVEKMDPQTKIWLAGFSFGSNISIRAAMQRKVAGLISIAPPVNHFPLHDAPHITCPWIIVQGEKDDVVPAPTVLDWVTTLKPQPKVIRFPEAGHFFHGNLTDLKEALVKDLTGLI